MAASFPASAKAFTTKSDGAGNTILAAHVNDVQLEITAIEQCLLGSTALNAVLTSVTVSANMGLVATGKIYLDGIAMTGDTYIQESAANVLSLFAGGVEARFTATGLTVGGIVSTGAVTVSGFGTNAFSAGGTGANILGVRNTTAGTGNLTELRVGNDAAADRFYIDTLSSTYTPAGVNFADGSVIGNSGAGGLSIAATHASGALRFYSGGTTERAQFNSDGIFIYTRNPTTANAANAVLDATDFTLRRSTSSLRYKTDVDPLDPVSTVAALRAFRPVTYRGKDDIDRRRYVGFIAEDVAVIAPLLATYDEGGESGTPNYVTYDRVPAYLIVGWQQHDARLQALEEKAWKKSKPTTGNSAR